MATSLKDTVLAWLTALLGLTGAFFVAAIVGLFLGNNQYIWFEITSGTLASSAVVLTAYWLAPEGKEVFAIICYITGAIVAWPILSGSSFPEMSKIGPPYTPTYIPLIATYASGGFTLILCLFYSYRNKSGV